MASATIMWCRARSSSPGELAPADALGTGNSLKRMAHTSRLMGFYATSAHTAATVSLKAGEKLLYRETVDINPGKPFRHQVSLPPGVEEHDLVAALSAAGKELVSYRPVGLNPLPVPEAVTPATPTLRRENHQGAVSDRAAGPAISRSGNRPRTLLAGSPPPRLR